MKMRRKITIRKRRKRRRKIKRRILGKRLGNAGSITPPIESYSPSCS
jgi:hypothetical protein